MPVDTETNGCEVMVPLDSAEQRDLERIESTIAANLAGFFRVGYALMEIKQRKLYRGEFKTFDEYCRKRWEMHKAYAYRLIGAAEICKNLSPIGDLPLPENEYQVRPLIGLGPVVALKAWRRAVAEVRAGRKITGAVVQKAVAEVTRRPMKRKDEFLQANWQLLVGPLLDEARRRTQEGDQEAVAEIVERVSLLLLVGRRKAEEAASE